ncbi:MAG: sugar transporter, partial [Sphaerochaetaceae bacterium]
PYYGKSSSVVEAPSLKSSLAKQLSLEGPLLITNEQRTLEAISSNIYPVTPGDSLLLSYLEGKNNLSLKLQVDGNYKVVVPSFGTVEGRNKSFNQFADEIEKLVLNYNPYSQPKVTLISTGSFRVTVTGEVDSTKELSAWGLSRLSSVVSGATENGSTRNVKVISADGTSQTYDLYAALKEGSLDQNPLLKAGDIVVIKKADKLISLGGEISRVGVYQPLAQESLATVIERYGKGILPSGDSNSILIRRYSEDSSQNIDVIKVEPNQRDNFILKHMDTIFVNQKSPLSRAVTIEGAVNIASGEKSSSLSSSAILYYQFFPGESVLQMLQNISNRFSAVSDLASTYLIRENQLIPIDVQAILVGKQEEGASVVLKEGDRFVVPFNQLFVNVTGAVLRPGTFPYVPDKKASYYINLAGGFDPAKNKKDTFSIVDKYGNKLKEDESIPPEALISAKLNTFTAVNALNLATTVTIVGLVATILTIILDLGKITNL